MHEIETVGYCVKMLRDMFELKKGETVAITYDTESCGALAEATAQAAWLLGGIPLLMKNVTTRAPGREGDADLPIEVMSAALSNTDIWIEYNSSNIYSSTVFNNVEQENKKIRYLLLMGMDTGGFKRLIGSVNMPALGALSDKVQKLTAAAKKMRITSKAGTDISFENVADRPICIEGTSIKPGDLTMVPGQISWTPDFDTFNGTIVGEVSMKPLEELDAPIRLTVAKGYITNIEGGDSARQVESYFKHFNDPNMYRMAHVSYGFNPGARRGNGVVENERLWGSMVFGFGNIDPTLIRGSQLDKDNPEGLHADGHTDAISLQTDVWLDDKKLFENGELVGPTQEIVDLAQRAKNG